MARSLSSCPKRHSVQWPGACRMQAPLILGAPVKNVRERQVRDHDVVWREALRRALLLDHVTQPVHAQQLPRHHRQQVAVRQHHALPRTAPREVSVPRPSAGSHRPACASPAATPPPPPAGCRASARNATYSTAPGTRCTLPLDQVAQLAHAEHLPKHDQQATGHQQGALLRTTWPPQVRAPPSVALPAKLQSQTNANAARRTHMACRLHMCLKRYR